MHFMWNCLRLHKSISIVKTIRFCNWYAIVWDEDLLCICKHICTLKLCKSISQRVSFILLQLGSRKRRVNKMQLTSLAQLSSFKWCSACLLTQWNYRKVANLESIFSIHCTTLLGHVTKMRIFLLRQWLRFTNRVD